MKKILLPLAFLLLLCSCETTVPYDVKYEVTSDADKVTVTFQNEKQGTGQEIVDEFPWTKEFVAESGFCARLMATIGLPNIDPPIEDEENRKQVTVKLFLNGEEIKYATSIGNGTTAAVGHKLPKKKGL